MRPLIVIFIFVFGLSSCKKPSKGNYQLVLINNSGISSIPYRGEEYKVTATNIYYKGNIEGVLDKNKKNIFGTLILTNPNGIAFSVSLVGKIIKESGFNHNKITGTYNSGTFEITKTN